MTRRLLFAVLLLSAGRVLGAQSAPDSAQCRVALTAASRDSQSTGIGIRVAPFDTTNHLGATYAGLIGLGIHQLLALPNPMSLHVYDPETALMHAGKRDSGVAVPTLRGAYRAMLHRDGHLTQIRAVSGTRDEAFDEAIVHAMEQLSASELLPPPSAPDVSFRGDQLDLRIVVTPAAVAVLPQVVNWPQAEGVTPLLLVRLPIRHITQDVRVRANGRGPVYPEDLLRARIEGSTMFEFVVDTSGRVDLGSVTVLRSSAPQFIGAVFDALPKLQFEPMYVEGCPVPVLVQEPFEFTLAGK